jgi:hypothetical protein
VYHLIEHEWNRGEPASESKQVYAEHKRSQIKKTPIGKKENGET